MPPKGCAFCPIVAGEAPAAIVYEDDRSIAFLDARPVFLGHTLLVPREHHETLPDLPLAAVEPFFRAARLLAEAVPRGVQAEGSFCAINNRISQSVPHLHFHIIPRQRGDGLRGFFWPRTTYASEDDREVVRRAIADAVSAAR